MWPFRPNPVRAYLWDKMARTTTKEGAGVVSDAMRLQRKYPDLSGPELIRLAYWGTSGTAP